MNTIYDVLEEYKFVLTYFHMPQNKCKFVKHFNRLLYVVIIYFLIYAKALHSYQYCAKKNLPNDRILS